MRKSVIFVGVIFCSSVILQSEASSLVRKPKKPYYTVDLSGIEANELNALEPLEPEGVVGSVDPSEGLSDLPVTVEERLRERAELYSKAILKSKKSHRRGSGQRIVRSWDEWVNRNESSKFEKKLVCYYTVPTFQDRPFAVFPEQIDPTLCTHIILGFARVVNSTIQPNDLRDLEFYNRTLQLKSRNKDLKIILTIGNGQKETGFPSMVASNVTRNKFILDCMKLLETYPFDGFDMDWEFPAYYGEMEERNQFMGFLEEFRNHSDSVGPKIILTAAVAAPKAIVDISYDIPKLAGVLDFVNVMAYDFHYYLWYSPITGPNAPLDKSGYDLGITSTLNTAWAAKYWYQCGMPANKIIVGAPTYGHTYRLIDKDDNGYNALAGGAGSVGQNGYAAYPEVCNFLGTNNTVVRFDNETQVPYAYNTESLDWVSFDNEQSAQQKAKFVNDFDLGGVMIWCINNDDAWKMCNTSQVVFPIINTYKTELFRKLS
ncbi:unnamed protein product [Allacma fusca]|uniref:GH18 domain-containing protein n=1 Tax=Allacma fusca TaxID=39272 RepID=A0A8J2PQI8_9HEXA|nr:unnamed protein product [Allacma fusca]